MIYGDKLMLHIIDTQLSLSPGLCSALRFAASLRAHPLKTHDVIPVLAAEADNAESTEALPKTFCSSSE